MERETKFVEIILPLALKGELTYRVPFDMQDHVKVGQRAIVQLGKKKLYAGVISEVHTRVPTKYQAKYIEHLLDESPVVTLRQIGFWKWIASYYLCEIGEVMSAALPASLKLASETKVVLVSDEIDYNQLDKKETLIIEALQNQKEISLQDVSSILELKSIMPIVNGLIKKNLVITLEEFYERVKPKKISHVFFTDYSAIEENRHEILDDLQKRAFKQLELFMAFMQLNQTEDGSVQKKKLLEYAGSNEGTLKSLRDKNILAVKQIEISRIQDLKPTEKVKALSDVQNQALQSLKEALKEKDTCLFHGVTSSGKTEVYSELIQEQLDLGKSVLFLVPEIALTTQLISRLQARFGDLVGVYHSRFGLGERSEVWSEALQGKKSRFKIFIGARSAIFLPFHDLGLIVVDEEHDASYKQYDPAPRYNARDVALVLAHTHKAKTILGSATPGVESMFNATNGKYCYVNLNKRFGDISLPVIEPVDLREELAAGQMQEEFSSVLIDAISSTLENGEQVILFQNRRGYSPVWQCVTCGNIPQCVRCDVSLNYHKPINTLKCHYCGYQISPAPTECNVCASKTYKMVGFGTQKIEEQLQNIFPDIKIGRMDYDTTRAKSGYENIINEFQSGYTDILVGTQMVSKGLDFDNVGLVGIMQADHMLKFPDFRADERSFQLMSQVSGRAGRRKKQGRVIIQSYFPSHPIIEAVKEHDYEVFFNRELLERQKYFYPPYFRLIKITLKHRSIEELNQLSKELVYKLSQVFPNRVLGPEFPSVMRIQNFFIKNMMVKYEKEHSPKAVKIELMKIIDSFKKQHGNARLRIKIDVDPA